jgi:hypothetical protein
MFDRQNQFQNAGQNGNFSYVSIAGGVPSMLLVILAFFLLVVLLRSEKRYRLLLASLGQERAEKDLTPTLD